MISPTDITTLTQNFADKFGALSLEQLNWKPNAETWSIAQNVDHLIAVNESYFLIVADIRKNKYKLPFIARFPVVTNFFGRFILNAVEPTRKRKMKTFPVWQPQASDINGNILAEFSKSQEELKKVFNNCTDLFNTAQIISSPANQMIVYKLETAFEIIVAHQKRHYHQAVEVLGLFL